MTKARLIAVSYNSIPFVEIKSGLLVKLVITKTFFWDDVQEI